MTIELNGERVELGDRAPRSRPRSSALGAGGERRGVAVAVDGEVVPRSAVGRDRSWRRPDGSRSWGRSRVASRHEQRRDDQHLAARRPRVALAADRRHRRLPLARADGGRARGLRDRDRHRRPAPGEPRGAGVADRPDRAARPLLPAEHGRLLHGPRRGPDRAAGARGVRDRLGQARGDRRRPHPAPRRAGAADRGRDAGRRGLHGAPLHERRPDPRPPPGGGGVRGGDAARLADRLRLPGSATPTTCGSSSRARRCR